MAEWEPNACRATPTVRPRQHRQHRPAATRHNAGPGLAEQTTLWGPVELRRYLHLFRRRWPVLLACIVVGAAIGWAVSPRGHSYASTSEIYVGTKQIQVNQNQLYAQGGLTTVVATYAAMIPSDSFAELALVGSGIDRSPAQVAAETNSTVVFGTTLIDVTVTDRSPLVAQKLASSISAVFASEATTGPATTPLPGSVPGETAWVFQVAGPGAPLLHHTSREVTLGAVFGLIVGMLVVLLFDYLDTTVRGTETIERRLGLPVLAVVPVRDRPGGLPGPRRSTWASGGQRV